MILWEKRLFNTTGPPPPHPTPHLSVFFFVIACPEILMRLCLHRLCLGYLPPTDEQAGCYGCGTVQPFKNKKQKKNRIKYKPHGDGIGNQPVLGTLFPSHCDLGLSLPLSSIVPWHNVFVCHLLEETCSAAGFTPSPSALPCPNTSPRLWFITTLLLSPNPLVMLPVLARPKIEDLSPRSRL